MISINDQNVEISAPDKTTLLSYLRNELGLSGPSWAVEKASVVLAWCLSMGALKHRAICLFGQ